MCQRQQWCIFVFYCLKNKIVFTSILRSGILTKKNTILKGGINHDSDFKNLPPQPFLWLTANASSVLGKERINYCSKHICDYTTVSNATQEKSGMLFSFENQVKIILIIIASLTIY